MDFEMDFEREYYEEPDYDAYERIQLDRDRDMGEFEYDAREPEEVFYTFEEADFILDEMEVSE